MAINQVLINALIDERTEIEAELETVQQKELKLKERLNAVMVLLNGSPSKIIPTPVAETKYEFPYDSKMIWAHKCYAAVVALEQAFSSDVMDFIAGMDNREAHEIEGNVSQAMNKLKADGYIKQTGKQGKKYIYGIVPEKFDEIDTARMIS